MRTRRTALANLAALVVAMTASQAAGAAIWTPYPSNTTEPITAVDYGAPGRLLYATTAGKIFKNGIERLSVPKIAFRDIALSPDGTKGLAVGARASGAFRAVLYRSADGGDTWSAVDLTGTTWDHACSGSGVFSPATPSDLTALAWGDGTTAYAVGADRGVVLKTTDAGASWADTSRRSDGTCRVDADRLTDVATIPGTGTVWIVSRDQGRRFISSDGLASPATVRAGGGAGCSDGFPALALDAANPNRSFIADRCTLQAQWAYGEDGGTTYSLGMQVPNGDLSTFSGLSDTAIAGGVAIAAGGDGAILISMTGREGYVVRAAGADARQDWFAVDKFDAAHAAVAGKAGRLLLTDRADVVPDITPPVGRIEGPAVATVGVPVTYTAEVTDEAGGSGIDPAGFLWRMSQFTGWTENPVTMTFPTAGTQLVTVRFRDLEGNSATATLAVEVQPAPTPTPAPTRRRVSKALSSGTATLSLPRACVPAGKSLEATFGFRRRKGGAGRRAKVLEVEFFVDGKRKRTDRRAPYTQKLSTKRLERGKHTLRTRVTLRLAGGVKTRTSLTTTFRIC